MRHITQDSRLRDIMRKLNSKPGFWIRPDINLVFKGKDDEELKEQILNEAYHLRYTVHPGNTKMYNLNRGY